MILPIADASFMDAPRSTEPHCAIVYRRRDGLMFYGATWPEKELAGFRPGRNACYRVRIHMKAKP